VFEDNLSYFFTCDECGWSTFVDKPTDERYPHLCNPCYRAFRRKGDNCKNWEEGEWSYKRQEEKE